MGSNKRSTRESALHALNIGPVASGELNAAPEIVRAAIHSFDEVGYEPTSFRRIAEIAGTSKSLVTYFFPTKRALAGTIIELAYPGGVFMGTKRAEENPLDAIVYVAEHVAESILRDPLARVALMLVERQSLVPQLTVGRFSGWTARLTDYLEEAQSKGLVLQAADATREAKYLLCGIIGLVEVARDTGAYLHLVEDAVRLTRDRLLHIRTDRGAYRGHAPGSPE